MSLWGDERTGGMRVDMVRCHRSAPAARIDDALGQRGRLRARIGHLVDEVLLYPFIVIGTPLQPTETGGARPSVGYADVDRRIALNQQRTTLPCYQLWTYLNVTLEGYLSACCSDFDADLVVGDLRRQTIQEAWHSPEFQALRQRHIEGRIGGTLCDGCIAQRRLPYAPINRHLMDDAEPHGAKSQSHGGSVA